LHDAIFRFETREKSVREVPDLMKTIKQELNAR
jgi:hypothetical protein